MPKLVMCKGLPGSGKSTWARGWVANSPESVVRVNKDDIRKELGFDRGSFTRMKEVAVVDRRDHLISQALNGGYTVISDDTNFGKKHEPRLRELAAQFGAEFEIQDFTNVPVETCIERDAARPDGERVGEDVIWGMAEKHLGLTRPKGYVEDEDLPGVVICDLDGTLAIHQDRGPYDFQKCNTDRVNKAVRSCLWAVVNSGVKVIYLSGRDDIVKQKTLEWIGDNECPEGPLFMRVTGDKRNDAIVKRELFDAHVNGQYHVLFVLDDRDRVVKMWRDLGLSCFQVNYGDF